MKRRQFFASTTLGALGMLLVPTGGAFAQEGKKNNKKKYDHSALPKFRIRTLTSGPRHHFFGYYGTSPWSLSEKQMVGMESSFQDRLPEAGESARIGLVDPVSGIFNPLTETQAWNLQQGAMIHWNPLHPTKKSSITTQ